MTDPDRIRAAIERCITASPAPPTTDDIAAAALWAAAEHVEPSWAGADCISHLRGLAAELEGAQASKSTH